MTTKNDKIVKISEKELYELYLDRGYDDIMSFPDYKQAFIDSGCKVTKR